MPPTSPPDLLARVQQAGPALRILLDTNAVAVRQIFEEAARVANWNDRVHQGAPGRELRLAVSALAHAEVLLDLRQKRGDGFDAGKVRDGLRSKGIEIVAFGETDAERLAEAWMTIAPDDAAWRRAKARPVWGWCRPGELLPTSVPRCSATVDWWIAGTALTEDTVVVSDDSGPEWQMSGITRIHRVEYLALLVALDSVVSGLR